MNSMQQWEFHELTRQTVRAFLPRIPQKYVDGLEDTLIGGEFAIAMEDLVYTVVDDKVPVTSNERDTLYQLVRYLRQNEGFLSKLEQLIVVEDETD